MVSNFYSMKLQTLENYSLQHIVQAFNKAFSQYFVPIRMSSSILEQKMNAENILLRFSVGAFDRKEIGGFILHALDTIDGEKVVYNGGTGVIPSFRGRNITQQLYRFIIPLLQVEDVKKCLLEVIDINRPAIYVYEKIGFQKRRELSCFKGTLQSKELDSKGIEIKVVEQPHWSILPQYWIAQPTWQNSIASLQRSFALQQFIGLFDGKHMAAYGIVHATSGRIGQFGVHPDYRGQGLGRLLFYHLSKVGSPRLSIINIDKKDVVTHGFLNHIGLENFLGQWEMQLPI